MTEANEPPVGSQEWRQQETSHTIRLIEELCGYRKPTSPVLGYAQDFGQASFVFTEEMPQFIWRINLFHKPTTLFPHIDVMHRWYLLNSLLVLESQPPPMHVNTFYHDPEYYIADNRHLLATMVSFTLIEELAFQLSKKWDEQGIVTVLLDNPRLKGKSGNKRLYNVSEQISSFHHKLILLEESLPPNIQAFMFDMNKKLKGWGAIAGIDHQPKDLYTRLNEKRNSLAHGSTGYGWEGWLISLLVNYIYLSFDENFPATGQV